MAISPMGIVNAANPRQAALETFDVAGLIHGGPASGFCRDAACALAAALAEAFTLGASVASMLDAATRYLHPVSAREMIGCIGQAQDLAHKMGNYAAFRTAFYADYLRAEQCDARETVPVALALFALADGQAERAILQGVNFGRDADTIGTMVGGLCGALGGAIALPAPWMAKVEACPDVPYREWTHRLCGVVARRARAAAEYARVIESLQ